MSGLPWMFDDGGRAEAGFTGTTHQDCVVRSIAIVGELPYGDVYAAIAAGNAAIGEPRSARNGALRKVYDVYLRELGWVWTPTMHIGSGCRVHLREGELPDDGRLLVRVTRHLTALVDGVVHDTHDPSREGSRCVYGFWTPT